MSDIRLGNPSIPISVSDYGTYIARLEDIWNGAREYAKQNNYKVMEGLRRYGSCSLYSKTG